MGGKSSRAEAQDCARHYVAGGDHIAFGHEVSEDQRYSNQLLDDHLRTWGPWCVYNTSANEATSSTYITGGQLAQAWNMRPDLITLTLGGEDATIIKLITECFDKLKDHDFTGANVCAATVLGNTSVWSNLNLKLTTILQQYRVIMAGRPKLMVAVTGYPNPYPKSLTASSKIALLCTPLIDTIPTCIARWVQLPPALETLDQAIKKLNTTIKTAVNPFAIGSGGRFVFVDTYTKTRDHCMKMEVDIRTTVEHPEQNGAIHHHNSPSVNFGCDESWYVEGDDGTKIPDYLDPAAIGILIEKSQTTKGMGIHPNEEGHKCISNLVWEADTLEPGVTPLKWKLSIPEAPNSNICQ
jgi:lysophospholipase L1-like esterase